jgi:RNA polymerase sigma-70 factor (ECF subfamily)
MSEAPTPGATVNDSSAASCGSVESDTTLRLLGLARAGNREAVNILYARYLPRLRRWASGRLPAWARDARETQDLVQDTLLQALGHLEHFEPRHEGALQAYLRQTVLNRIRDELRRVDRRPALTSLDGREVDRGPSPLEAAIGSEAILRYEEALTRLRPEEREAVIARVELGYNYEELAMALGKPSSEAARKAAGRALVRLAEEMQRGQEGS